MQSKYYFENLFSTYYFINVPDLFSSRGRSFAAKARFIPYLVGTFSFRLALENNSKY